MTIVNDSATRFFSSGPLKLGFFATLGVLLALTLGFAIGSLSYPLTLIFFALFVTLGLYPVVQKLESWKFSRTGAVLSVTAAFLVIVSLFATLVLPAVLEQGVLLIKYVPNGLNDIVTQEWFVSLNDFLGGGLVPLVDALEDALSDPAVWVAIGGGALKVGVSVVNAIFGTIFVVALTIYFIVSLESMKGGLYMVVPASRRAGFSEIAEEIFGNVGGYLGGMFVLALMNATFSFVLLTLLGVPFAGVLAAFALPITFIPVVGSLISAAAMTFVALFTSPEAGITVLIVMLVYLQFEAYFLTPRIVGKAIQIPGYLVLIGAMIGATLLGLLGALIACPITAAILLITKKVIVPAQAKL